GEDQPRRFAPGPRGHTALRRVAGECHQGDLDFPGLRASAGDQDGWVTRYCINGPRSWNSTSHGRLVSANQIWSISGGNPEYWSTMASARILIFISESSSDS